MSTQFMKPLHWYAPITGIERRDDGNLLVTGYAYVNAEVGDGYNLTRAAMEEASADYMRWGAVREMHERSAVGTATADGCGVAWDEKGARLTALIVDRDAKAKCEAGVYKGFSVGVRPQLMRGREVRKCLWLENSLVDRPHDPDATFTVGRAEGVEDPGAEFEVTVEAADAERGETSETVPVRENLEGGERPQVKGILHYDCGTEGCHGHITRGGAHECMIARGVEAEAPNALADLEDLAGLLRAEAEGVAEGDERGTEILRGVLSALAPFAPAPEAPEPDPEVTAALSRLAELETSHPDLLTRAETAERETATARQELSAAKEEILRLGKLPDPSKPPPVRFTQGLPREFTANLQRDDADRLSVEALRADYQRTLTAAEGEPDQVRRQPFIVRLNTLKMALSQLGATP